MYRQTDTLLIKTKKVILVMNHPLEQTVGNKDIHTKPESKLWGYKPIRQNNQLCGSYSTNKGTEQRTVLILYYDLKYCSAHVSITSQCVKDEKCKCKQKQGFALCVFFS